MSIDDSTGIQALLDQLKSSQAWREAVATPSASNPNQPLSGTADNEHTRAEEDTSSPAPSMSSVAALLSQLQSDPGPGDAPDHTSNFSSFTSSYPKNPTPNNDLRYLAYRQALPVVADLSEDPKFTEALRTMKEAQNTLESRLWEERKAIVGKYQEKIQVAKTRGAMIGSGISRHEANMLSEAFNKELKRFDAERVLSAWDGLVSQQQEALAQMGVPCMFSTTERSDREV